MEHLPWSFEADTKRYKHEEVAFPKESEKIDFLCAVASRAGFSLKGLLVIR